MACKLLIQVGKLLREEENKCTDCTDYTNWTNLKQLNWTQLHLPEMHQSALNCTKLNPTELQCNSWTQLNCPLLLTYSELLLNIPPSCCSLGSWEYSSWVPLSSLSLISYFAWPSIKHHFKTWLLPSTNWTSLHCLRWKVCAKGTSVFQTEGLKIVVQLDD